VGLLQSELDRIKAELWFNLLQVGAEPYVSITRYFEQIVLPNLSAGALTSSPTQVTAVAPGSPAAPVTLTLASAVGFSTLSRVIIDVDDLQEAATVQAVSGATITLPLRLGHTGTYPVNVEGGESLVREYLVRCRRVADLIGKYGSRAGVKSIDKGDVEFYGGAHEKNGLRTLADLQTQVRSELCSLLFGVGNIQQFGRSGSRVSMY
jgi:hypothetical protein